MCSRSCMPCLQMACQCSNAPVSRLVKTQREDKNHRDAEALCRLMPPLFNLERFPGQSADFAQFLSRDWLRGSRHCWVAWVWCGNPCVVFLTSRDRRVWGLRIGAWSTCHQPGTLTWSWSLYPLPRYGFSAQKFPSRVLRQPKLNTTDTSHYRLFETARHKGREQPLSVGICEFKHHVWNWKRQHQCQNKLLPALTFPHFGSNSTFSK